MQLVASFLLLLGAEGCTSGPSWATSTLSHQDRCIARLGVVRHNSHHTSLLDVKALTAFRVIFGCQRGLSLFQCAFKSQRSKFKYLTLSATYCRCLSSNGLP